MNTFEKTVITINNKENYYIVKQLIHNDCIYLLANSLDSNKEPTNEIAIMRIDIINNSVKAVLEKDKDVLQVLMKLFEEQL